MNDLTTLLVSDDPALIRFLTEAVQSARHCVLELVPRLGDVHSKAANEGLAMVIVHLQKGDDIGNVARLREFLKQSGSTGALLIICDDYRPSQARESLMFGAIDYLPRPLDFNQVAFLVEMQVLRLMRRATSGKRTVPALEIRSLGSSKPFLYTPNSTGEHLANMIRRVAPLPSTVLLGGETGSGKSLLARLIHELSPRRDMPFLAVNCGALTASLIESELFGHVKGAFTGAEAVNVGKFAAAGEGTLFLDEIDTLPLSLQAKLLRAVEERCFEPVGSNKTQPMRARLIVASNRPLELEVKAGRFRSDLFFRLNVVSLEVPPLRERGSAVMHQLSLRFLATFAKQAKRRIDGITPEALCQLGAYQWPGNVRELRNIIERAVALSIEEIIGLDDLPTYVSTSSKPNGRQIEPPNSEPVSDLRAFTPQIESRDEEAILRITKALAQHGNNRRRAALELGISRMTLYNKLHKYHLDAPNTVHKSPTMLASI
jgi:two-component system, NtrC family, response regulator HydG